MLAKLNYLNAHNFPIFQPILMILVSKCTVHRALSNKTYLLLGLLSPLTKSLYVITVLIPRNLVQPLYILYLQAGLNHMSKKHMIADVVAIIGKSTVYSRTYTVKPALSGHSKRRQPGRVAQSVPCLATDASLTADPGVSSSILAQSHTLVEIDHEIISMFILLPSAKSFKKGCCQLQAKVCARSTG